MSRWWVSSWKSPSSGGPNVITTENESFCSRCKKKPISLHCIFTNYSLDNWLTFTHNIDFTLWDYSLNNFANTDTATEDISKVDAYLWRPIDCDHSERLTRTDVGQTHPVADGARRPAVFWLLCWWWRCSRCWPCVFCSFKKKLQYPDRGRWALEFWFQ